MGAAARMKLCQSDIWVLGFSTQISDCQNEIVPVRYLGAEPQAGGCGVGLVDDHEVIGLIAGRQYLVFSKRLRPEVREIGDRGCVDLPDLVFRIDGQLEA